MAKTEYDDSGISEKLRVFSGGFMGALVQETIEDIGAQMADRARRNAQGAFQNRTGKLLSSIAFLPSPEKKGGGALTTRTEWGRPNRWYANMVENHANIQAKKKPYLMFKIDGEWKKAKNVQQRPRPFMKPAFNEFWEGEKGLRMFEASLAKKINEGLE